MKFPLYRFHTPTKRWLPQVLAVLMTLQPSVSAQAPPPAAAPATMQSLKVVALAGNGEMNDLQRKIMAPLVIQVLDQDGRPVEGADVTFRFPLSGPGATFPDQKTALTVRTNADGQAAAVGWTANGTVGRFQVQLTASRGNELGAAVISMTNVTTITDEGKTKRKSWWSSKWVKIGVIAGAAAVVTVVILANRGGSSGTSTTTITAVPGFPTIGGAQ